MSATPSNIASLLAAAAAKAPAKPKPASAPDAATLVWETIDPATLPDDLREAFYAIGKAKSAFEALMSARLEPPAHLRLVFAYKRGLAIALTTRRTARDGLAALMSRITDAE